MSRTQKILINKCYGGFGFSAEVINWLVENRGWQAATEEEVYSDDNNKPYVYFYDFKHSIYALCPRDVLNERTDKDVIDCFEALGTERFSGRFADVALVEIPARVSWKISEYDGVEHIAETHRTWY